MVPEGVRQWSSARTFSSAGACWGPQGSGTDIAVRDPPPFPRFSKPQATTGQASWSWRKRAAQNASETFSKVKTPRGEGPMPPCPHPPHRMGTLPELARVPPLLLSCIIAQLSNVEVSCQFVTGSWCLANLGQAGNVEMDGPIRGAAGRKGGRGSGCSSGGGPSIGHDSAPPPVRLGCRLSVLWAASAGGGDDSSEPVDGESGVVDR